MESGALVFREAPLPRIALLCNFIRATRGTSSPVRHYLARDCAVRFANIQPDGSIGWSIHLALDEGAG